MRIVFDSIDIDSCELCLALNGKEFDKDNFPELPFENCSSETGCMCRIDYVFDDDEGDDLESENGENLVEKLKQLKEMLDNGLISQTEYEEKKAEILSRI